MSGTVLLLLLFVCDDDDNKASPPPPYIVLAPYQWNEMWNDENIFDSFKPQQQQGKYECEVSIPPAEAAAAD